MTRLEVLFTPAEFAALRQRDLSQTCCVVFDVLRATSSMIVALANGADGIQPVSDIAEALHIRRNNPGVLLAGERDGVRIPAELADGTAFELGNSPREFTSAAVRRRLIAMTTTNGTRALRACAGAQNVFAACFLNLTATAELVCRTKPATILVVCSGTYEETAYEDVLGAGAFCELVWEQCRDAVADSAYLARRLYGMEAPRLPEAIAFSRNGRRLLKHAELSADVAYCLQRDSHPLLAGLDRSGLVRRIDHLHAVAT